MALLTCSNLVLGYGGKSIVNGLSFAVEKADYLCVVGENGSGKSTLIKTLLGLLPLIDGEIKIGDGLQKNEIGYLPQQTLVQKDFPASVEEIVLSGCLNRCGLRPFYGAEERQAAKENMNKLGIYELRKSCYRELSGGQQQRVLLARALCAGRSLLLLDEPAAGLDPKAAQDMYDVIEKLNSEDKTGVIMVSHDMDAAMKYADHILHIGKKIFFGKKEEYNVIGN